MSLAPRGALAAVAAMTAAPLSVVASIQPYSTVEAPAITAQFHHDAVQFPFQALSPRVAGAHRLYQAATVERFIAMLLEPRLGTNQQSYAALAPHVLPKLSSLTTEYTTVFKPHHDRPPAWGSVELVPAAATSDAPGSQTGYCGLSVSLWDQTHTPITTSLLTGTSTGTELQRNANEFVLRLRSPQQLPHHVEEHLARGKERLAFLSPRDNDEDSLNGREEPMLVGDLTSVAQSAWSQYVVFPGGDREGSRRPDTGLPEVTLTGWAFDMALMKAATRLVSATAHGYLAMPERLGYPSGSTWAPSLINSMTTPPLVLASRNITLLPLDMMRPVHFVMATPMVWPRFSVPAWEQTIGSPALQGEPMVAIKFRVFQEGVKCGEGTVSYTPWVNATGGSLK